MTTIHLHATTRLTPEQFIAGLTDFGTGRAALFANSSDKDLVVHRQGPSSADVTEGSGGVWERLSYDWSDRSRVVLKTTDSNAWSNASGHIYQLSRRADGATDIEYTVVRKGKNARGRFIAGAFGLFGKGTLGKAFRNSIAAMEARTPSTGERAA